ncbi:hypothetical protein [Sphingomonas immobilis]|uniref:Uncharacterized protein n=1 Tax=Sphingomonas immobilis TaxID=3063997 RepID=A0ABT9A4H0_9SPHN|nr:hypothetical protein [Sphingomonas sp. CA1-15]MDO7843861.1 hypothetical protein [Sphingomonas sp. CA1-15]
MTSQDAQRPDYYARRAAQERALAERSKDPSARLIHAELAARYAEMIAPVTA